MEIICLIYHLLFLVPSHPTSIAVHDLHLSKSEIRHNTENEALEISVKIFIDDLELTLEEAGHPALNILGPEEHPSTDSILNSYLTQHLQIATDDELLEPFYIGKELSEDMIAVWCYLEVSNFSDFRRMDIHNQILLELYDDQKNIVAYYKDRKNLRYDFFDHQQQYMTIKN